MVLGVSRDSVEDNAAFAAKNDFPYCLLSDISGELCRAYQACGDEPDSLAQRISYVVGRDGRIALILEQIAPTEHADQALAFLAELGEATEW